MSEFTGLAYVPWAPSVWVVLTFRQGTWKTNKRKLSRRSEYVLAEWVLASTVACLFVALMIFWCGLETRTRFCRLVLLLLPCGVYLFNSLDYLYKQKITFHCLYGFPIVELIDLCVQLWTKKKVNEWKPFWMCLAFIFKVLTTVTLSSKCSDPATVLDAPPRPWVSVP